MVKTETDKLLAGIRKKLESTSYELSNYGKIDHFINTGDYGLNRIISGDFKGGIPSGRVTLISGESGSGKSFIACTIMANALKENNYDICFYLDSEGGALQSFLKNVGCDLSRIEHVLVNDVEDLQLKSIQILDWVKATQETTPEFKALIVLDSLGALVAGKLISDAGKDKVASDMGGRSKLCNNFVKSCTIPCLKTNTPFLILNHIYDDPAAMFQSTIKNQGGGKGVQYLARVTIQCTKKFEKNDKKKADDNSDGEMSSTILRFLTVKNSVVKPFYKTEMYLNFSKGPNKYFGLVPIAVKHGFITNPKMGFYCVPSFNPEKNMRLSQLLTGKEADDIWDTILDNLNEVSKNQIQYSSEEKDVIDDIMDME